MGQTLGEYLADRERAKWRGLRKGEEPYQTTNMELAAFMLVRGFKLLYAGPWTCYEWQFYFSVPQGEGVEAYRAYLFGASIRPCAYAEALESLQELRRAYKVHYTERKRAEWDRRVRWAGRERPHCKNHPDKVVKRSYWLHSGHHLCSTCFNRTPDGWLRPWNERYRKSAHGKEQHKWRMKSWRLARKIEETKF